MLPQKLVNIRDNFVSYKLTHYLLVLPLYCPLGSMSNRRINKQTILREPRKHFSNKATLQQPFARFTKSYYAHSPKTQACGGVQSRLISQRVPRKHLVDRPVTFVLLEGDDKLGPLFQAIQEEVNQVSHVVGVGGLEGKLLSPNCAQCEALQERTISSENRKEASRDEEQQLT